VREWQLIRWGCPADPGFTWEEWDSCLLIIPPARLNCHVFLVTRAQTWFPTHGKCLLNICFFCKDLEKPHPIASWSCTFRPSHPVPKTSSPHAVPAGLAGRVDLTEDQETLCGLNLSPKAPALVCITNPFTFSLSTHGPFLSFFREHPDLCLLAFSPREMQGGLLVLQRLCAAVI
jgi:hypothetical protein